MTLREGGTKAREAGQHVKKVVRKMLNAATGGFIMVCFGMCFAGAIEYEALIFEGRRQVPGASRNEIEDAVRKSGM